MDARSTARTAGHVQVFQPGFASASLIGKSPDSRFVQQKLNAIMAQTYVILL
jgi:hypothetical protein